MTVAPVTTCLLTLALVLAIGGYTVWAAAIAVAMTLFEFFLPTTAAPPTYEDLGELDGE